MATNDLRGFSKRISTTGNRVVDNGNKIKRRVALAIDRNVVLATPVDVGRARSNWQVEVSTPWSSSRGAYVPGKKGSTGGANNRAAVDQAQAAIQGAKPGQVIHITNNLSYIAALNNGTSAQAPQNFVEKAVLNGVAEIRGAKILVDKSTSED